MKHVLTAVLCIAIPIAMFAAEKDNGYKVTYDGGSLPDTKSGTGVKIYIEANQVRLAKDNADVVKIPASAITEISYGQDVHRRIGTAVAVGVFTGRRQIHWTEEEKPGAPFSRVLCEKWDRVR